MLPGHPEHDCLQLRLVEEIPPEFNTNGPKDD